MSAAKRNLAVVLAVGLVFAGSTATAEAEFSSDDIEVQVLNAAGEPETRAGAHPDRFITTIVVDPENKEDVKDIGLDFPPGFGGDPRAVPICPRTLFDEIEECPAGSQVGRLEIEGDAETKIHDVYNLEPGPNEVAVFGARILATTLKFIGSLRPGDQGLSMTLSNLPQDEFVGGSPRATRFEFWGVPRDHQEGVSVPRGALLTNPTRCGEPLAVTVQIRTWERPDFSARATGDTGLPIDGCEDLDFAPRVGFGLSDPRPDTPTGVELELTSSSSADPDGLVGSQIEDVSVALPDGVAISLAAAGGLAACSDARFGLVGDTPQECPPASRVGSVEIVAPQLSRPLRGAMYLGEETAAERFRLLVQVSGSGVDTRFVGSMRADPVSGRLTARLEDLPQVALERLSMRFDGGPGALLATPLDCGPAVATATFVPYSRGAAVRSDAAVTIGRPGGQPCPATAPFEPSFVAGSTNARAGRPTSFTTTLRRRDGEQLADRFSVALPAGLSAALGSVDLCAATAAAAAACPAASRVGSAVAEIGSGPSPAALSGDVFLTGPYKRAPFGFAIGFRAALGPFDLGDLVLRAALRVDPLSGRIAIETDPLPRAIEGIPIRFQTIGLDIDRPGFTRNPTSCTPSSATATIRSTAGAVVRPESRFFSRGCVLLPFRPSLAMALSGERELRERGKPGLRISMRMPRRGANLRAAEFSLPRALRFDASGLREICARRAASAGNCPAGSRVGSASGRSPLLDGSLQGSIYLVQPRGGGSPDIWTSFGGDGIEIHLRGETAVVDGRAETRLVEMPDFPLTSFAMRLAGGKRGIFRLTRSPCGERAQIAATKIEGQNGALRTTRSRVATPGACGHDG